MNRELLKTAIDKRLRQAERMAAVDPGQKTNLIREIRRVPRLEKPTLTSSRMKAGQGLPTSPSKLLARARRNKQAQFIGRIVHPDQAHGDWIRNQLQGTLDTTINWRDMSPEFYERSKRSGLRFMPYTRRHNIASRVARLAALRK